MGSYVPDVEHRGIEAAELKREKRLGDPWAGARVYCRGGLSKGRLGYILSSNPVLRTARVMFDGAVEKIAARVYFSQLLAV